MGLLDWMVFVSLYKELTICSIDLLPAMCECSNCFTFLSAFGIVSSFYFSFFNKWVIVSHWDFISLMTNEVECISGAYLLFIYHFWWSTCSDLSLIFKLGYWVFLLLSFQGSLQILDTNPLSYTHFANIPTQSVACLFIFLTLSQTITFYFLFF